jgi:DUF1680 family protein
LNPGGSQAIRQRAHERLHLLQWHGARKQTKLQDTIYFHSADQKSLYVNLFMCRRTLTWTERKVTLTQHTDFPYADTTIVTPAKAGA